MLFEREINATLEFLGLRSRAYYRVFRSPDGAEVLKDLVKFCRVKEPAWGQTPEDTSRLVGRYEVFQRIMQHMNLTPEELYLIYGGVFPLSEPQDDEQ